MEGNSFKFLTVFEINQTIGKRFSHHYNVEFEDFLLNQSAANIE